MAIAISKCLIVGVVHDDGSVFYPKGICIVISDFVVVNLRNPASKIFTVEECLPIIRWNGARSLDFLVFRSLSATGECYARKKEHGQRDFFHGYKQFGERQAKKIHSPI